MVGKSSIPAWAVCGVALGALLMQVQVAPAQDVPSVSVADAARAARVQKKGEKPGKVYTDDDIANLKGTVSVVGAAPAPDTPAAATAKPGDSDAKPVAKDEAYWRKTFAEARKKLADDSKELDILQREYNLKTEQYYTDPNAAMREQNSRQDLKDTQAKIDMKKMDVAADNDAITNLEEDLRKSGGDPGWEREP
jgi:hypothetical protein